MPICFKGKKELRCPYCKSNRLMFSGTQKGYGYVPDMELWTCVECHCTFSVKASEGKGKPDNGAVKISK